MMWYQEILPAYLMGSEPLPLATQLLGSGLQPLLTRARQSPTPLEAEGGGEQKGNWKAGETGRVGCQTAPLHWLLLLRRVEQPCQRDCMCLGGGL